MRWVDDLTFFRRSVLNPTTKRIIVALQKETFYGSALKLKRTHEPAAYGFRFRTAHGLILARNRQPWVCDLATGCEWWRNLQVIHGGNQYRMKRMSTGVLQGYFARELDTTNESRDVVISDITRLVIELMRVNIPVSHIRVALNRIMKTALVDLRKLRNLTHIPLSNLVAWRNLFDANERYNRLCQEQVLGHRELVSAL